MTKFSMEDGASAICQCWCGLGTERGGASLGAVECAALHATRELVSMGLGPWPVASRALALLAGGVGLLGGWVRALGVLDRLDAWILRLRAGMTGGGR